MKQKQYWDITLWSINGESVSFSYGKKITSYNKELIQHPRILNHQGFSMSSSDVFFKTKKKALSFWLGLCDSFGGMGFDGYMSRRFLDEKSGKWKEELHYYSDEFDVERWQRMN